MFCISLLYEHTTVQLSFLDSWKSESCEANLTVFGHDSGLVVLSLFSFFVVSCFLFVLFGIILRLELLLSLKARYRLTSPERERYA